MLAKILAIIANLISSGFITEAISLVEQIIALFEPTQQVQIKAALVSGIAASVKSAVAAEKK